MTKITIPDRGEDITTETIQHIADLLVAQCGAYLSYKHDGEAKVLEALGMAQFTVTKASQNAADYFNY